ncbi:MAG: methylenetetrahydrofolate reductase [Candidatus Nanopelagicales bacterium]|nr:methylenetetrahydrofolate reductase [Candidatus Nanopelagicales bacterium]
MSTEPSNNDSHSINVFEELCLSRARPVMTAELRSFDGENLAVVEKELTELTPYIDGINITDNPAAHAHASNTAMAIAVKTLGGNPIMQIVCRDKNRLAIQADLVGAGMFGVENFCALTGDDVTAGDEKEARRVFDLDGPQLVSVMTGISQGSYLSGRKLKSEPHMFIGAVENPTAPPLDYRVDRALKKVDAGAKFIQLQICYQPEKLEHFIRGCVLNGVAERAALLPTVVFTKSARPLGFMDTSVPGISVPKAVIDRVANSEDQAEESYQLVKEQVIYALGLPGVAGIHFSDFRHDGSLQRMLQELGLGPKGHDRQPKEDKNAYSH